MLREIIVPLRNHNVDVSIAQHLLQSIKEPFLYSDLSSIDTTSPSGQQIILTQLKSTTSDGSSNRLSYRTSERR